MIWHCSFLRQVKLLVLTWDATIFTTLTTFTSSLNCTSLMQLKGTYETSYNFITLYNKMLFHFDQDLSAPDRYGFQLCQGGLDWIWDNFTIKGAVKHWNRLSREEVATHLWSIGNSVLGKDQPSHTVLVLSSSFAHHTHFTVTTPNPACNLYPARREHQGDLVIIC